MDRRKFLGISAGAVAAGEIVTKAYEEGDNLLVRTYQDVEPHLKLAARERRVDSEERTAFGKRAEFRRTMTIPNNVMLQVCQKLGIQAGDMFQPEYAKKIYAELKKPEFKYFRTVSDKRI